ncbi:hypothetical protein F4777DRAFT_290814 [Nemania sp. FL0916]|nr:hypothetical protein F4777DRAFT_290814 [Nemania sp. FL0916]
MRLLPALAALSLAILAKAQNFSSYVPECAPPCVQQALNSTKLCTGLDDNQCLCNDFQQLILPARGCFISTCNVTNVDELRTTITTGWQKFCNDSGIAANISTGGFPGGPPGYGGGGGEQGGGRPGGSWSSMSSASPTSSTTSTVPPTASPTESSNTNSGAGSGLTTGAKAGIGVGVGVGGLAVIGGLVFLGFRLGQRRRRAEKGEGDHPEDGTKPPNSTSPDATSEAGGLSLAYKTGEEGDAYAELPSETYSHPELSGIDARRELPVTERPVELWHGAMPSELSADSEIPQDRARNRA